MLILRRRAGEAILIGDSIEIEVTEIGSSKVKIGIRAPAGIPVQRKELSLARQQNRSAAAIPDEQKSALAQKISRFFSQTVPPSSDKNFEARYSGHPQGEPGTGRMPGCIPQQDVQHVDLHSNQRNFPDRAE